MLSKNQIKEIQRLHLKKEREQHQLFIVEGIKSALEFISAYPGKVVNLFAVTRFVSNHAKELAAIKSRVVEVSEEELKKISLQANPNEVLLTCRYLDFIENKTYGSKSFSLYLDDIRDPGNLGTIMRLADWFGIGTIFCSPETCEVYNPKVIQASMGAFMRVNVVYAGLGEIIERYDISKVYGAVLNGKNIYNEKLESGIVVIGNEANGINEENMKAINFPLTIPAASGSGTESLNAAMATAIICSEFFRNLQE
jgi:RNA methyltransferase, TrmH family